MSTVRANGIEARGMRAFGVWAANDARLSPLFTRHGCACSVYR